MIKSPAPANKVKILINGALFTIDMKYEYIVELVPAPFAKRADEIERLHDYNQEKVKELVEQAIKEGYAKDPATGYFLSLVLLNYGELNKANKLTLALYHANPTSLIARCAYANYLFFSRQVDQVPAIFGNTFDLSKITERRELSFAEILKFLNIAILYYLIKQDIRAKDYIALLVAIAPNHPDTQKHIIQLLESELSDHMVDGEVQ